MRTRRPARGSGFVEVLLAMTIMALVLVGILQMFSVSLVINKGSAARTQMLFRCQQVVENIRYFYYLSRSGSPTPAIITDSAHVTGVMAVPGTLPAALTAACASPCVDRTFLPYTATDATWDYWGPSGANVIEQDKGPYKISYTIDLDTVQKIWVVTVSATPTDDTTATRYFGVGLQSGKRVDYVAELPLQ